MWLLLVIINADNYAFNSCNQLSYIFYKGEEKPNCNFSSNYSNLKIIDVMYYYDNDTLHLDPTIIFTSFCPFTQSQISTEILLQNEFTLKMYFFTPKNNIEKKILNKRAFRLHIQKKKVGKKKKKDDKIT